MNERFNQWEKLGKENATHIKRMNSEMGELRDEQKRIIKETEEIKNILSNHRVVFTTNKTNIEWLREQLGRLDNRMWIILTTIIVGILIQIALKLL